MAQLARPDSDVSTGAWATTPLWSDIDEVAADDDTTMVQSADDPSSDIFEVGLTNVTDPVSATSHTYRFRHKHTTTGGGSPPTFNLKCELFQGTTLIATTNVNTSDASWVTTGLSLSGAEADAISDYTDLRLRLTANKTAGSRTGRVHVTWAELEVPNVVSSRERMM